MPATPASTRRLRNALAVPVVALLAAVLALASAPQPAEAASTSGTLSLSPGTYANAAITTTSLADSMVSGNFTVPSAKPVYLGLQLRNSGVKTGYRAKASVNGAGAITVGISRVSDYAETKLASVSTGLTVTSGAQVFVEAASVGSNPVQVYVKAWTSGNGFTGWQLSYMDYTSSRITASGAPNVWAYLSGNASASATIPYTGVSVSSYTAALASASTVGTSVVSDKPTSTVTAATTSTFPTDASTGVKSGSTLTRHDGNITVTTAGTVLENLDIHGFVTVKAKNVTIRNSIVRGGKQQGTQQGLITNYGYDNLVIEDVDVKAEYPSVYFDGIKGWDFTATRVHVVGNVDSVKIHGDNVTVQDSLLEDTTYYASDPAQDGGATHNDNIQILTGTNLKITGNTIQGATNFAILGGAEQGDVNLTVTGNYLDGGHCTVKLQVKNSNSETAKVTKNTFGPNRTVSSCAFTAYPAVSLTQSGNVFTDGTSVTPVIVVS
ncbi:hypothetical protein [Micropruina sp.]|uniref:hypothetical protein n=1 Tax=Micropruina sp. TaxID=2737536 RepID=UPI0039E4F6C2